MCGRRQWRALNRQLSCAQIPQHQLAGVRAADDEVCMKRRHQGHQRGRLEQRAAQCVSASAARAASSRHTMTAHLAGEYILRTIAHIQIPYEHDSVRLVKRVRISVVAGAE